MKRGNDGEKIMGPMFPRLHVNDTEKGGPRAPPRNKMALYEQLSIPSKRINHVMLPHNPNNNTSCSVLPSSLHGGNDQDMLSSRQVHPAYPSDEQYNQYSELSPPLEQGEQRKKIGEDDYRVPIFIHPILAEANKYSKGNESMTGRNQTVSSISYEPGVNLTYSVDILRTDDSGQPELCAESRLSGNIQSADAMGANMAAASATAKRNSSNSEEALQLVDQNIVHDLSSDSGSGVDLSCRSHNARDLERGDSVSETSILDTESALEITPDDVVGTIGQKQFWKARRAIMNQQRVFAIQVFELHRLIKVQRLIAASPHLLHSEAAYFDKPAKPSQGKKRSLDCAVNVLSSASKAKDNSEIQSHKKEHSAENNVDKSPSSSAQNTIPPSSYRPPAASSSPASIVSSDNNVHMSYFSHPQLQGHQWLIPVMSPSEGLVYKPCPAPGYVGQGSGGYCPPMIGNFLAPVYGVPAPSPQYPFPSVPPYGPHGYFPHYGMPIMSSAAFSTSSIEKMHLSARSSTSTGPAQNNENAPEGLSRHAAEEIEVQGSSGSSLSERQQPCVEGRNTLPLFTASSPPTDVSNSSHLVAAPRDRPQVIKVVPHNGVLASESAARIFQSIQEERKQYD